MDLMWKLFVQVAIAVAILAYSASGVCVLNENIENGFVVVKDFGLKKVIMSTKFRSIKIDVGEAVDAYCDSSFEGFNGIGKEIQIHCIEGSRFVYRLIGHNGDITSDYSLTCKVSDLLLLYESERKLAGCEPHTSLALGVHRPTLQAYVARVCYDWSSLDLKFITYMANVGPSTGVLKRDSQLDKMEFATKDKKVSNFEEYFNFMSEDQFANSYKALQKNYTSLEQFNFDYESIVQDRPLALILKPYSKMLNIIWWRNLRLGNWRTFLSLLEERSASVKYNVVMGTSGKIVIPKLVKSCQMNETLSIFANDNIAKIAPAYIWAHLKAITQNITEDFVVIGYNSPFYLPEDSTVLCHDICDEIDWLSRFGKMRLMPAMGFIICCRPDDVAH